MATNKAKSSTKKTGTATRKKSASASKRSTSSKSGREMTDRVEIQAWAEERNAVPSCVKKTGGRGDGGMIRLDFPGYSGEESLQEISWEDWFEKFEENNLALIVQDKTAGGQKSNFNKLVKRTSSQKRPKTRAAS